MPKKANNHTVPKFYLRNFADAPGGRRIRVFRIEARQHIHGASIKDQCAKKYFYGTSGKVEDGLAELENAVSPIIKELFRSERVPPPGSQELDLLLTFVAFQEGRTVAAAERENVASTHLARAYFALDPGAPQEVRENLGEIQFNHDEPALASLHVMAQCVPLIRDLRLKILRNDSAIEFITSDAPVVLHNHWARKSRAFSPIGLTSAGLQIFCPLSPKYLALLYDTDIYFVGKSKDDVVAIDDPEQVRSVNLLQVVSASANLYYSSGNMIGEIDRMPTDLRQSMEDRNPVQTLTEEDGPSHLIVYSRRPHAVTLEVPTIQIRDQARGVPHLSRGREYRPEARALAGYLFPREHSEPEPGKPAVTKYVACD